MPIGTSDMKRSWTPELRLSSNILDPEVGSQFSLGEIFSEENLLIPVKTALPSESKDHVSIVPGST